MSPYATASLEPELNEVLDDPIIRLIMEKDGVARDALLPLLDESGCRPSSSAQLQ